MSVGCWGAFGEVAVEKQGREVNQDSARVETASMSVRGEVVALEQQRQSSRAGQRVGEDVPEIEAGRMTSLAEAAVGLRRCRGLLPIDRLDHDERFVQKVPNALVEDLIATRYRDQLDDRRRRDQDATGAGDGGLKSRSIRLAPQNADDRRGVDDDHLGNPCSS